MQQASVPVDKLESGQQMSSTGAVPERPTLAPNVQLVGKMQGAGFADQQWLVQRDGQFLQLPEIFYRVVEGINGERTLDDIAAVVTESTEWAVTPDNVRQILQTKLIPMGLVPAADGAVTRRERSGSALDISGRMRVISPRLIGAIAGVLQVFFLPPLLIPLLIAIAVAHGWLYFAHGTTAGIIEVLYTPSLLLAVVAIAIVGAVCHELGHAAALRYGGAEVRGMGVGFYLIYPAFYTDTTDAYRLGRWARVRTDLGGFYFHLLFALGIFALYFATGREFLLVIVLLINLDILVQCLPFVRFDGYWALADLTGIPDFFSQIGPFLRSVLPLPGWKGERLPDVKPWVRWVFALYILVTIPVWTWLLIRIVTRLPLLTSTTWGSFRLLQGGLVDAFREGDYANVAMSTLLIAILVLPLVGALFVLYHAVAKPLLALWSWSGASPARRIPTALGLAAVLALGSLLVLPRLFASGAPDGVQRYEVASRNHVNDTVVYLQNPPVGGDHAPFWQNCRFYDRPIANENGVHALEHGAVWITYRPDLPAKEVALLRQLANRQNYTLVSPYPDLPTPVVASAWGHQLPLTSASDRRLDQFIRAFRLGDQAPERGGGCSGGVDTAR